MSDEQISPEQEPLFDLVLEEYSSCEVRLPPEDLRALRDRFQGRLDLISVYGDDRVRIKTCQYAGFVVLPSGRRIEVRPKVPLDILLALIGKVHGLAEFLPEMAGFDTLPELFEYMADTFLGVTEELATRGILQGFQQQEDDLVALRGKLLVTETLRRHPVVRTRHVCSFTHFTPDIPENQILRGAVDLLSYFPFHAGSVGPLRVRRLQRVLGRVHSPADTGPLFERLVFHRLNEHYRPSLALARILLERSSVSGAVGSHRFQSFLVNMDTLFEGFVANCLLEEARRRPGCQVVPKERQYLDTEDQLYLLPDITVRQGGQSVLVIDTKYKRTRQATDFYQVLAYCHAVGVTRGVVAVPDTGDSSWEVHRIREPGACTIRVLPLDLSGTLSTLMDSVRDFAEQLLGPRH